MVPENVLREQSLITAGVGLERKPMGYETKFNNLNGL